jgi:hypothetical protein
MDHFKLLRDFGFAFENPEKYRQIIALFISLNHSNRLGQKREIRFT